MKCKIAVYACHAFTDIEYLREREKRTNFPQEILEIQRPLNKKRGNWDCKNMYLHCFHSLLAYLIYIVLYFFKRSLFLRFKVFKDTDMRSVCEVKSPTFNSRRKPLLLPRETTKE